LARIIKKLNHKGSTLLMVIICLAFIGILGSLMLSVSMINLQMKQVENNSKQNFYVCEKALEEIKAGLLELTATEIKSEYENVLRSYVTYSIQNEVKRNETIQGEIIDNLQLKFSSTLDAASILTSYLSQPTGYNITVGDIIVPGLNSFVLKDVKINYKNAYGYSSAITSDLRITLPDFTFSDATDTIERSMKHPYEGYALIADGKVLSQNSTGVSAGDSSIIKRSQENSVNGSIYAGAGITIQDTNLTDVYAHKMIINGSYIVTRGDILVEDTAMLTIGNSIRPLLWANNLFTDTTASYTATYSFKTRMNIDAICLLKDDLTLEARNSEAILEGAYIGYTGAEYDETSDTYKHTKFGSSIIINGAGSSLNLADLSSLVLAGRAHISFDDSDFNIMTGESLAFKSNQRAYLVPGKYISTLEDDKVTYQTANHNPLTDQDLANGDPKIQITAPAAGELDYTAYIDSAMQYKKASKVSVADKGTLNYYYLNFNSGINADRFIRDYFTTNSYMKKAWDAFPMGNVLLPDAAYVKSAGNVMKYTTGSDTPVDYYPGMSSLSSTYPDDKSLEQGIAGLDFNTLNHNDVYTGTDLLNADSDTVGELSELYFNMTHYLSPIKSRNELRSEDKAVEATLLRSGIAELIGGFSNGPMNDPDFNFYSFLPAVGNPLLNTLDTEAKSVVVLSGDAQIVENGYFNGLLITTGNVRIKKGATINGLIIAAGTASTPGTVTIEDNVTVNGRIVATGDIIMGSGCVIDCLGVTSLDSGASVEDFINPMLDSEADKLGKLFLDAGVTVNITSGGSSAGLVKIDNLVTAENWRREE